MIVWAIVNGGFRDRCHWVETKAPLFPRFLAWGRRLNFLPFSFLICKTKMEYQVPQRIVPRWCRDPDSHSICLIQMLIALLVITIMHSFTHSFFKYFLVAYTSVLDSGNDQHPSCNNAGIIQPCSKVHTSFETAESFSALRWWSTATLPVW